MAYTGFEAYLDTPSQEAGDEQKKKQKAQASGYTGFEAFLEPEPVVEPVKPTPKVSQ